jgi:hypothetical protein
VDADDRLIRSRYVGIYRAIAARSVRYLVVCVGATLLTALAVVVWLVPLLTPTFVTALPLPVAIAALLAVVFLAAGVIPTVLQLAITPRDLQRAFEAWNAFALLDKARWVRTAGKAPPTFRNPEAGLAWIAHHPLTDPLQRRKHRRARLQRPAYDCHRDGHRWGGWIHHLVPLTIDWRPALPGTAEEEPNARTPSDPGVL